MDKLIFNVRSTLILLTRETELRRAGLVEMTTCKMKSDSSSPQQLPASTPILALISTDLGRRRFSKS